MKKYVKLSIGFVIGFLVVDSVFATDLSNLETITSSQTPYWESCGTGEGWSFKHPWYGCFGLLYTNDILQVGYTQLSGVVSYYGYMLSGNGNLGNLVVDNSIGKYKLGTTEYYFCEYKSGGGGNSLMVEVDRMYTCPDIWENTVYGSPFYLQNWGALNGGGQPHGPTVSCTDGLQNQDETNIDYGGVCGGNIKTVVNGNTESICTVGKHVFSTDSINPSYNTGISFSGSTENVPTDWYGKYTFSGSKLYFGFKNLSLSGSIIDSDILGGTGASDLMARSDFFNLQDSLKNGPSMYIRGSVAPFSIVAIKGYGFDDGKAYFLDSQGENPNEYLADSFKIGDTTYFYSKTSLYKNFEIRVNNAEFGIQSVNFGTYTGGLVELNDCSLSAGVLVNKYTYDCIGTGESVLSYSTSETSTGGLYCHPENIIMGNGYSLSLLEGTGKNLCGIIGNDCIPQVQTSGSGTSENPYVGTIAVGTGTIVLQSENAIRPTSGGGGARNYTSISSSGGLFDFTTSFNLKEFPTSNTGACSSMFGSGGEFMYIASGTKIDIKINQNYHLNDGKPYTCTFGVVNTDPCKSVYNALDGALGFGQTAVNWTLDKVLSNSRSMIMFFGVPKAGSEYCFLGSSVVIPNKIQSYYSYSSKSTIDTSGVGVFDYLARGLLAFGMFKMIF